MRDGGEKFQTNSDPREHMPSISLTNLTSLSISKQVLLNTLKFNLSPGNQRIHFSLEELSVTHWQASTTPKEHEAPGWHLSCDKSVLQTPRVPASTGSRHVTVTEPGCASPELDPPSMSEWLIKLHECLSSSYLVIVPSSILVFVWLRGPS